LAERYDIQINKTSRNSILVQTNINNTRSDVASHRRTDGLRECSNDHPSPASAHVLISIRVVTRPHSGHATDGDPAADR
ncbi:MAG: hypothetical protein L6Q35_12510, partial [Phycisphaerales bacterium]|nr:hypothetical protein [Phycisphaerales bacterium]